MGIEHIKYGKAWFWIDMEDCFYYDPWSMFMSVRPDYSVLQLLLDIELLDSGQWTVDSGQWTVDSGYWTVDIGSSFQILEYLKGDSPILWIGMNEICYRWKNKQKMNNEWWMQCLCIVFSYWASFMVIVHGHSSSSPSASAILILQRKTKDSWLQPT